MRNHSLKKIAAVLVLGLTLNTFAFSADELLVKPASILVDHSISEAQINAQSLTARRYYTFWNTGDEKFAKAALAENFRDLNLPQGRPQGPDGPLQASTHFRKAVPDLKVSVVEMLVVGDKVVGHLHFTGHFTGTFMGQEGKGQAVDFYAVDIYRIAEGKIVEN